jgi:hypothetical protein
VERNVMGSAQIQGDLWGSRADEQSHKNAALHSQSNPHSNIATAS